MPIRNFYSTGQLDFYRQGQDLKWSLGIFLKQALQPYIHPIGDFLQTIGFSGDTDCAWVGQTL